EDPVTPRHIRRPGMPLRHASRPAGHPGPGPDRLAAPGPGRSLPQPLGPERPARLHEPDDAGPRQARRRADPHRRDRRARPDPVAADALLRHPPLRPAPEADVHEPRGQSPRLERGGGDRRDRPGRHPARHVPAPDDRRRDLQLRQGAGHLLPRRLHRDGRRHRRHHLHPRRPAGHRRAQGRAGAGRHLRDHRRRYRAGAAAAEHPHRGGRRGPLPHRLGDALGARQCALRAVLPGHRHRRGAIRDPAQPDADGRRQLAGGGRAEPRPQHQPAGAPDRARDAWRASAREHEARYPGPARTGRVRADGAAAEDQGRQRQHRRPQRDVL
ncbi:MAG: hypothetical protein AVDCRST_MAG27-3775, partial [uncultured Craurococcus sp.]